MKEIQAWFDIGCVMGLRTVLVGGAGSRNNMYGVAVGSTASMKLEPDEYLNEVDIKVGK
jgi:hypothetical protein